MFLFFNDTATTEIYTLSLHDALPISPAPLQNLGGTRNPYALEGYPWVGTVMYIVLPLLPLCMLASVIRDRKSTRLNSSHANISYAVFCLTKKQIQSVQYGTL